MLIWDGWFDGWSGSPSLSRKFLGHCENSFQQKSPCSPKGTRTEKTISAVPPCLPEIRPLCTVPTHRLPVNAGIASEDTLESSISPCPQRPICRSAFRSALSSAVLSVDALPVLLPLQWFAVLKLCLLYNKGVRLSSTIFHQWRTFQYSLTTPRTMPMISA